MFCFCCSHTNIQGDTANPLCSVNPPLPAVELLTLAAAAAAEDSCEEGSAATKPADTGSNVPWIHLAFCCSYKCAACGECIW